MKLLPVLFVFAALAVTISWVISQVPRESICLIQKGFTGPVFIVFDQKNGSAPDLENGRHVYKIPVDGILKTTVKGNFDIQENEFFYIDSQGMRTKIEYLNPSGGAWKDEKYSFDNIDKTKDEIFVFNDEMGGVEVNGKDVRFRQFLIGKPRDAEKLYLESNKKIAKTTGALDIWNNPPN